MSPRRAQPPPVDTNADPRKVNILVQLLQKRPHSYEALEAVSTLGLRERMLRVYIKQYLPAEGYEVKVSRNGRGPAQFSLEDGADNQGRGPTERASLALAHGVLEALFPLDGTALERVPKAQVVALASGVPRFKDWHKRALMRWINASEQKPPLALWVRYNNGKRVDRHLVWPLGVVLRDGRRVYLQGLLNPAEGPDCLRHYALERLQRSDHDPGVANAEALHQHLPDFVRDHRPHPLNMVDAPFSLIRPATDREVYVRVRFSADQARFLRERRWHRNQTEKLNRDDGTLNLTFGPVDCDEAVAWCSQWWQGITVLGDDKLRAAYEASLRDRLARQESAAPASAQRPSRPKAQRRPPPPRP